MTIHCYDDTQYLAVNIASGLLLVFAGYVLGRTVTLLDARRAMKAAVLSFVKGGRR